MNDFTKEELQHIYDGLWMLSKLGWEKSDLTKCKKIAGIIDNYCEHEFDMTDWVNDSSGCRWYQCKKCEGRYR